MNQPFDLLLPKSSVPPDGGWPTVLLLHGYGSNKESMTRVGEHATTRGFAAISVSGPISVGGGGFQWPTDSVTGTHEHVQSILKQASTRHSVNHQNVLLCGFSQGALHAVVLLAAYPQFYQAALAFSPGGWLDVPEKLEQPELPRPLVLSSGADELPSTTETVEVCQRLWEAAGFPLKVAEHDESHQLPRDSGARFDELLSLV